MKALADNDILLKGACYGLLWEFAEVIPGTGTIGVLGAARFVVVTQLKRKNLRSDPAAVEASLLQFLSENEMVEPTESERILAAELETAAQRLVVNLDAGESQLIAILILRSVPWLMTGDKRAIVAAERLFDSVEALAGLAGTVISLEQLVRAVLLRGSAIDLRAAICREPQIDRALAICFSCLNRQASAGTYMEALDSYIADLRRQAPRVLST